MRQCSVDESYKDESDNTNIELAGESAYRMAVGCSPVQACITSNYLGNLLSCCDFCNHQSEPNALAGLVRPLNTF